MAKTKVSLTVDTNKRDLRDAVVQAVTDLDTIIATFDTLDAAEVRLATKKLAQHQRKIVLRLAQL